MCRWHKQRYRLFIGAWARHPRRQTTAPAAVRALPAPPQTTTETTASSAGRVRRAPADAVARTYVRGYVPPRPACTSLPLSLKPRGVKRRGSLLALEERVLGRGSSSPLALGPQRPPASNEAALAAIARARDALDRALLDDAPAAGGDAAGGDATELNIDGEVLTPGARRALALQATEATAYEGSSRGAAPAELGRNADTASAAIRADDDEAHTWLGPLVQAGIGQGKRRRLEAMMMPPPPVRREGDTAAVAEAEVQAPPPQPALPDVASLDRPRAAPSAAIAASSLRARATNSTNGAPKKAAHLLTVDAARTVMAACSPSAAPAPHPPGLCNDSDSIDPSVAALLAPIRDAKAAILCGGPEATLPLPAPPRAEKAHALPQPGPPPTPLQGDLSSYSAKLASELWRRADAACPSPW